MKPIVILDRDGTLIEDRHYIRQAEDVVFFPGAFEALRTIQAKGYPLYLVSNQSGIGRGIISDTAFAQVHRRFNDLLKEQEIVFEEIAYCFHAPEENCPCRKPRTGLAPRSFRGEPIDWKRSFVVGDHEPDLGLGKALGAQTCLLLTGKGSTVKQNGIPGGVQVFESILEFSKAMIPVKAL